MNSIWIGEDPGVPFWDVKPGMDLIHSQVNWSMNHARKNAIQVHGSSLWKMMWCIKGGEQQTNKGKNKVRSWFGALWRVIGFNFSCSLSFWWTCGIRGIFDYAYEISMFPFPWQAHDFIVKSNISLQWSIISWLMAPEKALEFEWSSEWSVSATAGKLFFQHQRQRM